MRAKPPTRLVQLDASRSGLALLRRFHDEAYVAQFPDPDERESMAQMARYLKRKAQGWYGPNNYHVLVALRGDAPVGGVVLDYLAEPNCGLIEFLFVLPNARGAGLGTRLLKGGLRLVRADARRSGKRLNAVAAEMNDPLRRPAKPDNMDPFARAAMWGHWGFQKLLCPYAQPALSSEQGAVDYLTLIVRPLMRPRAESVPAGWVLCLVAEYMRWAMRIRQPTRQREYQALGAFLAQHRRVPLLPLAASMGHDPARPFEVLPVDSEQPDFDAVVGLARDAIAVPGHVAARAVFESALAAARAGGPACHLWRVALPASSAVQGMASFFSLPGSGFGGYIVLEGALRGRGLLALLIARMEAQMMVDGVAADSTVPGWFIECADDSAPVFLRQGFGKVPLDYCPPSILPAPQRPAEPLHLLFKPFGTAFGPLVLKHEFVLQALREILRHVYGIKRPTQHASYRRAASSLASNGTGQVQLITGDAPDRS